MAVDPNLLVIKPVNELETVPTTDAGDLLYYDRNDELKKTSVKGFTDKMVSGIKGTATQSNAPTAYSAGTHPNGLFEKWEVTAPITSPNSWGNIAVTQAELDANFVYFTVTNGVVEKVLSLKPIYLPKNAFNETDNVEGSTDKATDTYFKTNFYTKPQAEVKIIELTASKGIVDGSENNKEVYNKAQTEARIKANLSGFAAGVNLGFITPTTAAPPSSGIHIGQASTAGTYTNFGELTVTSTELQSNVVYLQVKDGVASKVVLPFNFVSQINNKFDKAGGVIGGRTYIGAPADPSKIFNVFDDFKILDDETHAVIVGKSVNSAGAKLRVIHEDYNWHIPPANPGMIGSYSDLYIKQVETGATTIVADEAYVNISTPEGITNSGKPIGYLGGIMVMADHRGRLDQIAGSLIVNRFRPGAAGIVGSMSGVQSGFTSWGANSTIVGEHRAFETVNYDLQGATIADNYGLYLSNASITGVTRGWGVYQEGINDVNFFAGKVRMGYEDKEQLPSNNIALDVKGTGKFSEGFEAQAIKTRSNILIDKASSTVDSEISYLIDGSYRYSTVMTGAETGNIAGSNIVMYRYADDGSYLGMVYSINRATGNVSISEQLEAKTLKIKSSPLAEEPVPGTLEYDGTDLYFVSATGRKKIAFVND